MRNTMRKIFSVVLTGVLGLSAVSLGACSEPEVAEEPVEEEVVSELRVIGKETDTALMIEVTNKTGKDITSFAVKAMEEEDYQKSLVDEKTKIEADEAVIIYIEPYSASGSEGDTASGAESGTENEPAAESSESSSAAENDVVLRTLYNIALAFDDDATAVVHDLNLEGLPAFSIHLTSDGIAYIEYVNDDGKTESTLETERAIKLAEEEAAAQAQREQEEAAAEALAQAEAEEAPAAIDYGSDYSYDPGSGYVESTQSEDACVDDVIFN